MDSHSAVKNGFIQVSHFFQPNLRAFVIFRLRRPRPPSLVSRHTVSQSIRCKPLEPSGKGFLKIFSLHVRDLPEERWAVPVILTEHHSSREWKGFDFPASGKDFFKQFCPIREFDVHIGQNCLKKAFFELNPSWRPPSPLFALKASSPNEQRPLYLNVNWWINKPAFDSSEYTEIYTCS